MTQEKTTATKLDWREWLKSVDRPDMDAHRGLEELKQAKNMVFSLFGKFVTYDEQAPTEARVVEYEHVISQEDKDIGIIVLCRKYSMRPTMPKGTRIRHWISVLDMARLFFLVLVNDDIPYKADASDLEKSDDKVAALIAYDDLHDLGHGRFFIRWRERGDI